MGQTEKLKKKKQTKNKSRSMISPVRSRDREGSPGQVEGVLTVLLQIPPSSI